MQGKITLLCAMMAGQFLALPESARAASGGEIQVDIAVRPELGRHIELLQSPSYVLVALDNIRASPLTGGRIVVRDAASFRYRIVDAAFTGKQGDIYRYEGKISVGAGSLTGTMEVDTSRVAEGSAAVRISFPLATLLSEELVQRMRDKLALAADLRSQDRLLRYLSTLEARMAAASGPKPAISEMILADAHNASASMDRLAPEPGDAEPLSDQALLIATLLFWSGALLIALLWRRRALRASTRASGEAL